MERLYSLLAALQPIRSLNAAIAGSNTPRFFDCMGGRGYAQENATSLPGCRILRELGHGMRGKVYLAERL